eukprot:gene12316-biopygen7743
MLGFGDPAPPAIKRDGERKEARSVVRSRLVASLSRPAAEPEQRRAVHAGEELDRVADARGAHGARQPAVRVPREPAPRGGVLVPPQHAEGDAPPHRTLQ